MSPVVLADSHAKDQEHRVCRAAGYAGRAPLAVPRELEAAARVSAVRADRPDGERLARGSGVRVRAMPGAEVGAQGAGSRAPARRVPVRVRSVRGQEPKAAVPGSRSDGSCADLRPRVDVRSNGDRQRDDEGQDAADKQPQHAYRHEKRPGGTLLARCGSRAGPWTA